MEKNKVIISITIVTLIITIVVGGTYAWWTWVSANDDDTTVNVTVGGVDGSGTIKMILDGEGDIKVTNLVPTSCTNTTYTVHRTITYIVTNPTKVDATAKIQLNPSTFPTQLKNEKLMWKLTTGENCTGAEIASGTFENTTKGIIMDLTTKVGTTKSDGLSYYIPAETTTPLTGTYYLSIWLDYTYEGTTNVGNNVKDSIQDQSMILKLTGEITQSPS